MVMGSENELSLAIHPATERSRAGALASALVNGLRAEFPSVLTEEPAVNNAGVMLASGAKCYHELGDYLEVATPEVADPPAAPTPHWDRVWGSESRRLSRILKD